MSEPAAVKRARDLRRHVDKLGAPLDDFYVLVSKDEGVELLAWFRANVDESKLNVSLYDRDVRKALKKGDPFQVLEQFTLCGLQIKPSVRVH